MGTTINHVFVACISTTTTFSTNRTTIAMVTMGGAQIRTISLDRSFHLPPINTMLNNDSHVVLSPRRGPNPNPRQPTTALAEFHNPNAKFNRSELLHKSHNNPRCLQKYKRKVHFSFNPPSVP